MKRIELSDLLQRLPVCEKRPLRSDAPSAVSHPAAPLGFVAPPLRSVAPLPATLPGIVLVAAPGAVGKSTLARHLANERGSAYWDLSKLALGDNTFIGTIAAAFGDAELAKVLQGLRDGSTLFVIDALDEAEIRSGWPRVASFLSQVAARTALSPVPTVVLMARTDTARRAAAVLATAQPHAMPYTLLEVDFFDETSARRFVEAQLDELARSDAHRRHSVPFVAALDAVFAGVKDAIAGEADVRWSGMSERGVLGYAPFLQAVAAFLSRFDNYAGVAAELARSIANNGRDAILASLLEGLLQREHSKFISQLREIWPDALPQPEWSAIYSPSDQLARCVRFASGDPDATACPAGVPAQIVGEVVNRYRSFVPQHPFLREGAFAGPAFRDYVLAGSLASADDGIFAELLLDSADFVPTPLLASFFARLLKGPGRAEYAGYLYDSAVARFGLDRATVSTFISSDQENGAHTFQIVAADERGDESVALDLPLRIDESSRLMFRRHLRNAHIVVNGTIVLHGYDGDFDLVNVDVQCTRLVVRARRLVVSTSGERRGESALRAEQCEVPDGLLDLHLQEGSALSVRWDGSERYPWAPYHDNSIAEEPADRRGVLSALYRILKWFRKDRRNELGKVAAFIDNVVVGRHSGRQPLRTALLDFLLERGIIRLENRIYVIGDEMARRYGLNLPDLKAARPSKPLAQLIDEFLNGYPAGGRNEPSP